MTINPYGSCLQSALPLISNNIWLNKDSYPSLEPIKLYSNLSPIHELRDGACQSGRWFQGEQRVLSYKGEQWALGYKPWAGHMGIHSNSASGNHPPGTITLTMSVEILTNPKLTNSTNEGGKGRGEKQNNWMICCPKQTAPCTAETNNTRDSWNLVCHHKVHDSLTTIDQHCIASILT